MNTRKLLIIMGLVMALLALSWGIGQHAAEAQLIVGPNGYYVPDYFATPNWANSPPLPKFVDTLSPLGCATTNNLGQCIPVAVPDTATYPGSDYYVIELVEYRERMHSFFPALNNPDPMLATSGGTKLRGYRQVNHPNGSQAPHYLGPIIVASKFDSNYAPGAALPTGGVNGKPVRVKFINSLPTGAGGDLSLPVDTTIMGSGPFEINYDPVTKAPIPLTTGMFTQNRATLHLHGGRNPWISDGTAHQWITPAGETTAYPRGISAESVPDMPAPGPGEQTFYWTNQQSGRFMFYHDHAMGITRLNVYAGEAAGYVLQDSVELAMVNGGTVNGRTYTAGTIPADQIPLVIQEKTFVDANPASPSYVLNTDPTWAWGSSPGKPVAAPVSGDLWWPHVYMPAQNPFNPDLSGINAFGRWHYGPWFFPPTPVCGSSPDAVKPFCIENGTVANPYYDPACVPSLANGFFCQPPEMPGTPNPSWGAEAFLDTMVVNGTAYPTVTVQPKAYRFRILNAGNDRFVNLQLYKASPIVGGIAVVSGGSGYTTAPVVTITPAAGDTTGHGASATATIDPLTGAVSAINLDTVGSGYTAAPTVVVSAPTTSGGVQAVASAATYTAPTEVGMVPAALASGFPATWPADGREGGVPDPATKGPAMIQIGTEGGLLPKPLLLPNQPVAWNYDPTMFNFGNVLNWRDGGGTLFLGPAERADVIVDFSNYAGQTLILYNDAPTAFPALDPHYDYYTGAPDRRDIGGYGPIPPGVGPNVRTVMQITVAGTGGTAPPDDYNPATLAALETAFTSTTGAFASSQEPIVVGQTDYNATYNTTFPATWPNWGVSRISDTAISFQKVDGTLMSSFPMNPKAIHDEMGATFDDYGRMSAKLGLEVPFTNAAIANFILQNFVDPPTEIVQPGQIQIWKITHNGVDTHPIHFHLFDVQLINRVGWDGFIRIPDPNELGWKDTIRISPLEDTIVALRPVQPVVPFALPNSVRPLNPTTPLDSMMGFSQINVTDGAALEPPMTNHLVNFGWEYTWHCHLLSHEENDMMRAVSLAIPPEAPSGLAATLQGNKATLVWTDNSLNETSFAIQRATSPTGPWTIIGTVPGVAGTGSSATFVDHGLKNKVTYYYSVTANNTVGDIATASYPTVSMDSAPSNIISVTR